MHNYAAQGGDMEAAETFTLNPPEQDGVPDRVRKHTNALKMAVHLSTFM